MPQLKAVIAFHLFFPFSLLTIFPYLSHEPVTLPFFFFSDYCDFADFLIFWFSDFLIF